MLTHEIVGFAAGQASGCKYVCTYETVLKPGRALKDSACNRYEGD